MAGESREIRGKGGVPKEARLGESKLSEVSFRRLGDLTAVELGCSRGKTTFGSNANGTLRTTLSVAEGGN